MCFCRDNRDSLKKRHPHMDFKEFGKLLGQKWKLLGKEDKAPYVQKAKEDKARHASEMSQFNDLAEQVEIKRAETITQNISKDDITLYIKAMRRKVKTKMMDADVREETMQAMLEIVAEEADLTLLQKLHDA
jgi:hypothetical protein